MIIIFLFMALVEITLTFVAFGLAIVIGLIIAIASAIYYSRN